MSEFESWYLTDVVACCGKSALEQAEKNIAWLRDDGSYADTMLRLASLAWSASQKALLERQLREQEEFLAHLADYEHEDTFHG